jgi:hypothetical protein
MDNPPHQTDGPDPQTTWSDADLLADLQRASLDYFRQETNPENGLVRDRTRDDAPASIAAIGLALTACCAAVARGGYDRAEAAAHVLKTLRFLWQLPQGPEPDAAGHKGFFYHFLDMRTGRRVWNCELSTIDTALLMAGVLSAQAYFDRPAQDEADLRAFADRLYRRVDWRWALNRGETVTHGWRPGRGFLKGRWLGYDESLILYVLGLGAPEHRLPPSAYEAHCAGFVWTRNEHEPRFHAGPLFIHQLSQIWIDCRDIRDDACRAHDIDYFENSRRATHAQRRYAIANPRGFVGYHADSWGITASDGPGPAVKSVAGRRRRFWDYLARGAPEGPDDGTLSPWAVAASLPFAPEIVMPALRHFHAIGLRDAHPYGFTASFNPTFDRSNPRGWVAADHIGINQGPIGLMIENHRSGFVWTLMAKSPYIVEGLRRAGFRGGWLDRAAPAA